MLRRTAALPPGTFELLTDPGVLAELDGTTLKVLLGVAHHAAPSDQATWVVRTPRSQVADAIGVSLKTFRKHLLILQDTGWLLLGEQVSRGRNLGSDTGPIWLLWTAPLRSDGTPWRPTDGPNGGGTFSPGTFSPGNLSHVKTDHLYSVPSPTNGQLSTGSDLPSLHAGITPAPKEEHLEERVQQARVVGSSRLFDGEPCPLALDEALADLGLHGDVRIPGGMRIPVTAVDILEVVKWLLADRQKAQAQGKDFNAPGVLVNRLKTPEGLHQALSAASAQGYLARYREMVESRSLRPLWCGECDESSRMRENSDGFPYHCPACHPLSVAGEVMQPERSSTRPPWCGECEQSTRMREHVESGLPFRCPACHPLTGQQVAF